MDSIMKRLTLIFSLLLFFGINSCRETYTNYEPDEQYIQIHMKYGFKDEINTFNKQLTKDLVLDGIVTIEFWLTIEEQFRIEEMTCLVDFFSFPDTITNAFSDTIITLNPNPGIQSLRIKHESNDKTVFWYYPILNTDQAQKLIQLHDLIIEIIESKPEYHNLPEALGGYI